MHRVGASVAQCGLLMVVMVLQCCQNGGWCGRRAKTKEQWGTNDGDGMVIGPTTRVVNMT